MTLQPPPPDDWLLLALGVAAVLAAGWLVLVDLLRHAAGVRFPRIDWLTPAWLLGVGVTTVALWLVAY